MNTSFAQITRRLNVSVVLLALGGCASVPPPASELSAAQQALNRAVGADADQYAHTELARARDGVSRAQALSSAGQQDQARVTAQAAAADADLATASSKRQAIHRQYRQRRDDVLSLRQRLRVDDGALAPPVPAPGPVALPGPGGEALRLQRLDEDARLGGLAAYERLQARQALNALLTVKKKRDQADLAYVAARRIAIAELAAEVEWLRRQSDALERDRNDLMVEASRQEAENARQEVERMRVRAQIQAEEAQRAREEAALADAARQQAEQAIIRAGGAEARRLKAARAREAELARQEAELLGQDPGRADEPPKPTKGKRK